MPPPIRLCDLRVLLSCSSPGACHHTSYTSSTSRLFSASIPAEQYSELILTMHSIIQKQQALKQKEKQQGVKRYRSHFQRTPAFIQSALQAALATLAARAQQEQSAAGGMGQEVAEVPFPPPKGGFTDVGLHTGGQPKATAWPVLQSMVKVSWEPYQPLLLGTC